MGPGYAAFVLCLLLIALGCDQSSPSPARIPPISPERSAAALEADLSEALLLWQAQQYPLAQQAVQRAYREHFEPLEPYLPPENAQLTLELEYSFGALMHELRRGGDDEKIEARVAALSQRVRLALAALPEPPEDGAADP